MGGLAIGSLIGGRRADLLRNPLRVYGCVELGVGATALLTPWAFQALQTVFANSSDSLLIAGSLVADPSCLSRLGWSPTVTTPEGLAALARI